MTASTRIVITNAPPDAERPVEICEHKNAVAHVGKLYDVLAFEMADAIARSHPAIEDVSVQILSTIGALVTEPSLVAIHLRTADAGHAVEDSARQAAMRVLEEIDRLPHRLLQGEYTLY